MVPRKKKAAAKKKSSARKKVSMKKKVSVKKIPVKKAPVKKKAVAKKKAVSKKKAALKKKSTVKASPTKADTVAYIAEQTGLTKTDVLAVLEAQRNLMKRSLSRRTGTGDYTIPGLIKISVVRKARTKARRGVNPFTGEPIMIAAKPARNVVKLRALKGLKEMI
jgi:nucleoid DNA-binding protein